MASTYAVFLRQHSKPKARLRRLYWVCGPVDVLRQEVTERVRLMSEVEPIHTLRLNAAETPETEIWAALNQHPIDVDSSRLLVVTEAQRLTHLERLAEWVKDNQVARARSATAVFVSSDDDFPETEGEPTEEISKSSSAMIVRCAFPKAEDDRLKRAVEVVRSWGDIDPTVAGVLIKRVNFDMAEARAVMRKAALFPGRKINVRAVELLAPRRVEEDIVWSLVALNKRAAVEAAMEANPNSATHVIGALTTHVEALAMIHTRMNGTYSVKDVAKKISAKEGYVRMLYPHAKYYPRKEAVRRLLLLNRMDEAYQRGAREGVLESLIALW